MNILKTVKFVSAPVLTLAIGLVVVRAQTAPNRTVDASHYSDLRRWQHIGPLRGGRTVGAAGVAQQPNIFYIDVNNGGVWKTTDFGQT